MSHLYYTDSKLRILSSFHSKNSSFCSMCYSYILSSPFGLDRITTNRWKKYLLSKYFKLEIKNYPRNGERSTFRWTVYFTDSKLRILSSFRPKNSSFCSMCYSYILSSSFRLDRITTNRWKKYLLSKYFKLEIKKYPRNGERLIFRWATYYEKKYY